ncbi:hypothetical protein CDL15_Pgr008331 [Punica granatum]|uniref:Uncharacterized protein n=1 Tax=Punica granatum TaxID=22663 RepID=A0A218XRR9_PUNGR|nr:hypothetical protein CDL15_Pgr008331 [Punica granatum]
MQRLFVCDEQRTFFTVKGDESWAPPSALFSAEFVDLSSGRRESRKKHCAVQKNRAYKTFRSKGCKHYDLQQQLFSSSVATGVLSISSTDPPPTLEEERRLNAEFLSRGKGKQKHHVDLEEGSDESEPILTESRRRVPKRSQSKSSQMQECMDIFRESFTKNQQDTPPSAKKSKSVSSPKKPDKNSIEEALNELAKLESRTLNPCL